jgi:hypothetical protein
MFGSNFLNKHSRNESKKPTQVEMIYYLFWEKGIDFNSFNDLPLPYIFKILKAFNHVKEEEKKEIEKSKRRR